MPYKYAENDVLTLKGAAAQQTTNPGNLAYYKLCEEKFSEFSSTESKLARKNICIEIVATITDEYGGIFRKYNGAKMDTKSAITKTMDRFRQIQKPKVVPPKSIGENDVVFKVGAANHLFPGNAKWRLLLDQHVQRYWPELFLDCNDGSDGKADLEKETETETKNVNDFKRVRGQRPYYQMEIAHKLIDIIEDRGGKFHNATLDVLEEREGVLTKIHERFKDIKKYIKNGTYQRPVINNNNKKADHQNGDEEMAEAENFYKIKRTGCTSTKATILHGEQYKTLVTSPSSLALGSETNGDEEDSHGSLNKTESLGDGSTPKRKREQAQARRERTNRREEAMKNGISVVKPKTSVNRRKKAKGTLPPQLPDHEMSEYEMLRFEKMQRNYDRMVSLGLATTEG